MSATVDVLAVLREAMSWLPYDGDDNKIRERAEQSIAAVAELVDALRAAEGLAACCMAVDGYSRQELCDLAWGTMPVITAALAAFGSAK